MMKLYPISTNLKYARIRSFKGQLKKFTIKRKIPRRKVYFLCEWERDINVKLNEASKFNVKSKLASFHEFEMHPGAWQHTYFITPVEGHEDEFERNFKLVKEVLDIF